MVQVRVGAWNYLLKGKATPSNDHSFPFALRLRSASGWMAYVVFCSGAVVAHKLLGGFAEARELSRRRSCRPRASRPVSFSRRRCMAAVLALKDSFGLRLQPEFSRGETFKRHPSKSVVHRGFDDLQSWRNASGHELVEVRSAYGRKRHKPAAELGEAVFSLQRDGLR
jgi:hypothetical protein